ncbi:MAG: DNA methyltransferase, partial [Clostridia bacterium]|nr:DNA methyltransferase [Clostridia bacterium]
MIERKLTKEDIDRVRGIEGFPIAKDEDIIALSRPPYYTACPNPFIEDFIKEHGTPYDEATDDYHREPFAADVSEGKNDPIYNAHSYHTKVPYKAIMRYILHYTKPGDIVFDGFCGTGMTGVAAQMCGCPDEILIQQFKHDMPDILWGTRQSLLSDISPIATFIAYNYTSRINIADFAEEAARLIKQSEVECAWAYKTVFVDSSGKQQNDISGNPVMGTILDLIWSDIFICPSCTKEFPFYNVALDLDSGEVAESFECPHCKCLLKKRDCKNAFESVLDPVLGTVVTRTKRSLSAIKYLIGKKRYIKTPDSYDYAVQNKIENMPVEHWIPVDRMPEGRESRRNDKYGITHVHHFYDRRNLYILADFYSRIS